MVYNNKFSGVRVHRVLQHLRSSQVGRIGHIQGKREACLPSPCATATGVPHEHLSDNKLSKAQHNKSSVHVRTQTSNNTISFRGRNFDRVLSCSKRSVDGFFVRAVDLWLFFDVLFRTNLLSGIGQDLCKVALVLACVLYKLTALATTAELSPERVSSLLGDGTRSYRLGCASDLRACSRSSNFNG